MNVDLAELCIALKAESTELRWYLDSHTGAVILVTKEFDPQDHGGLTVAQIEAHPERFLKVPLATHAEGMEDMRQFAQDLDDEQLKVSIDLALNAPRPERRFKAVLGWLPGLVDQWHAFRQRRAEMRARRWLQSVGLAPR